MTKCRGLSALGLAPSADSHFFCARDMICICRQWDQDLQLGLRERSRMASEAEADHGRETSESGGTSDSFLLLSDHVWELEQRVAALEQRAVRDDLVIRADLRREVSGISQVFFRLAERVSILESRLADLARSLRACFSGFGS